MLKTPKTPNVVLPQIPPKVILGHFKLPKFAYFRSQTIFPMPLLIQQPISTFVCLQHIFVGYSWGYEVLPISFWI